MRLSTALLCSALLHVAFLAGVHQNQQQSSIQQKLQYPVRSLSVRLLISTEEKSEPIAEKWPIKEIEINQNTGQKGAIHALWPTHTISKIDTYLTTNELDIPPQILDAPNLDQIKLGPLVDGSAILRLWVNTAGTIDKLEIEKSSLPREAENFIIQNREKFRFEPGRKNLAPVKSIIRFQATLSREIQTKAIGTTQEH